jgi:hypothetical protein
MTLMSTPRRSTLQHAAGSGGVRTLQLDLCLQKLPDASGPLRAAQSRTESFARAADFLNLPPALPCVDQL